jgi:ribose transport system permease protein
MTFASLTARRPLPFGLTRLHREGATSTVVAFVVFLIVYLIVNPGLLTRFQLQSTANLVVPLAIVTIAQLIIVTTGGIDISIGAILSLCNVVFATQIGPLSLPVALVMTLVVGIACGLFNGVFVAYGKLPAIAVTLASAFIIGSISSLILDRPGGALDESVFLATSGEALPFVPIALLWLTLIAVGTWYVLQRTRVGRAIYGVGSSAQAVQAAGLKAQASTLFAFGLSGLLVAFAAIILAGSTMTGDPRSGDSYVLTSIAAVALSGASFAGGKGSILGAILAAVTLGMVGNLLYFAGINSYWQFVINALIVFAVVGLPVIISRTSGFMKGRINA